MHHACQAGAYDEAYKIFQERIYQRQSFVLTQKLGAYETALSTWTEFFPNGDTSQEPMVSNSGDKRFILNDMGLCLMSLGRLREAVPFYERKNRLYERTSQGYRNLAELHALLGALDTSVESARQAIEFAVITKNKQEECFDIVRQGWGEHLRGNLSVASELFLRAEKLEQETSQVKFLYGVRGVYHVNHLRYTSQPDYARRVTEANLQICERNHWVKSISQCHRILGDLDSDAGNHASTRTHYESALKIARSISVRDVLIEALLARGRWQAKHLKAHDRAFSDLNEALGYCVESGYRIYEADVRVALAWANLADLTPDPSPERRGESLAKAEAERALQMSNEMGYHWGKVDAEEVLGAISG